MNPQTTTSNSILRLTNLFPVLIKLNQKIITTVMNSTIIKVADQRLVIQLIIAVRAVASVITYSDFDSTSLSYKTIIY